MSMNIAEFFVKYKGKYLDYDKAFGAQCVDPIKAYFKEVLNLDPVSGNAIDYWRDIPGFQRIKNDIMSYPKPGDIAIWGKTPKNPYGHIAIVNWVRTFDLGVFEQNWPVGAPCGYRACSYSGILGWLRPVVVAPDATDTATYRVLYLSDTDDISSQVASCDRKLREFSGGRIRLSYDFRAIPKQSAPSGSSMRQDKVWQIVDAYAQKGYHGFVVGYHGTVQGAWYHTATTNKPYLYSAGQKPWPADVLLFEMKHQLTRFYNQHRGSFPSLQLVDNYTGGEAIIRKEIQALLPYLVVFRNHKEYT